MGIYLEHSKKLADNEVMTYENLYAKLNSLSDKNDFGQYVSIDTKNFKLFIDYVRQETGNEILVKKLLLISDEYLKRYEIPVYKIKKVLSKMKKIEEIRENLINQNLFL